MIKATCMKVNFSLSEKNSNHINKIFENYRSILTYIVYVCISGAASSSVLDSSSIKNEMPTLILNLSFYCSASSR